MCNPVKLTSRNGAASVPATSPLPVEGIPATTCAKVERVTGEVAAHGALVRYSNNQAYFVLQHLDEKLRNKAVIVSTPDIEEPLNLRIDGVFEQLPNLSHQPMYIQVHHNPPERLILEHLIDNLAETTLGRQNLELKKNVTIDLFDSDSDAYLRDRAGFMVADRMQFRQLVVRSVDAVKVLRNDENVNVVKFSPADLSDLVEYDNTLSAQTRPDFLEYLSSKCQVYVAKPRNAPPPASGDEDEEKDETLNINGYAVVTADGRVLGLYAQTAEIADTLLAAHIRDSKAKEVTICAIRDHWSHLAELPTTTQRAIYRRHTRAVPANVKWDRIFGVNVGMNLF